MAAVSSLHFHSLHSLSSFSRRHSPLHRVSRRKVNSAIISCRQSNGADQKCSRSGVVEGCAVRRRELLVGAAFATVALPSASSVALSDENDLEEGFRVYTDEVNKFKITIPQDWQVGTGEGDGVRALIAFYPPEASNSNVTLVITVLGADFTRLESFGKVDAFAETLVGGLDRSWQRPPGVAAKLVDSRSANGLYYIEYTLKNLDESRRHLLSVLGVANNGFYNRLYTLTGQFVDEEEAKFGPKVQKAVSSFRLFQ
ncbi:psbP domain-containing protein 3, chloroplastic [Andrographis paniculata]|uniref:psbP domain-containing protein 3, chloroplastic n=1 Tax=Andrographis paniculata TaxID=175694 RepID=UPI0021E76003|nr:psbP domain-containing protein 3, chloroplastic [Andrographis paniculata]